MTTAWIRRLRLWSLVPMLVPCAASSVEWSRIQRPPRSSIGVQAVRRTAVGWVAAGGSGLLLRSDDGKVWSDARPWRILAPGEADAPPRAALRDIASSGAVAVVVGDSGRVLASDDGLRWNEASVGDSIDLRAVAFGGDGFLAAGSGGRAFRSPDGRRWTESVFPGASRVDHLVRSGSVFLAADSSGALWRSADGTRWEDVSVPGIRVGEIAAAGGSILARAWRTGSTWESFPMRSTDAGSWSVDSLPGHRSVTGVGFRDSIPFCVAEDQDLFLGDSSGTWGNGSRWIDNGGRATSGRQIGYHDGIWFAARKGDLGGSRDLRDWWRAADARDDARCDALLSRPDGFWATASPGSGSPAAQLLHSVDLVRWDQSWLGGSWPEGFETAGGRTLLWGYNSCWVDFEGREPCAGSPDRPQSSLAAVDGSDLLQVVTPSTLSSGFSILWSGALRRVDSLPQPLPATALRRFRGEWIATAGGARAATLSTDSVRVLRSSDALAWTSRPTTRLSMVSSLSTDGRILVAVDDSGRVWRSSDAERWDPVGLDPAVPFVKTVESGGVLFALGRGWNLAWSADGSTWTMETLRNDGRGAAGIPSNSALRSVVARGDTVVVGGEDGAMFVSTGWRSVASTARTRAVPLRAWLAGRTLSVRVEEGDRGPWHLVDLAGHRRAEGRRTGPTRVRFDLGPEVRGILLLDGSRTGPIAIP